MSDLETTHAQFAGKYVIASLLLTHILLASHKWDAFKIKHSLML